MGNARKASKTAKQLYIEQVEAAIDRTPKTYIVKDVVRRDVPGLGLVNDVRLTHRTIRHIGLAEHNGVVDPDRYESEIIDKTLSPFRYGE